MRCYLLFLQTKGYPLLSLTLGGNEGLGVSVMVPSYRDSFLFENIRTFVLLRTYMDLPDEIKTLEERHYASLRRSDIIIA
jgi:hypothetical protein